MSANIGTKRVDWSKYGVVYGTMHKNLGTVGATIVIVRKDLIKEETVMSHVPRMANWSSFYNSANKIYNVPTIWSIWMHQLTTEYMLEKGGIDYFEERANRRSKMFYDYIDNSDGYYSTFVKDESFRSRMNVCFRIKNDDKVLTDKFISEAEKLGWIDIRGHPMTTKNFDDFSSNSLRVTMYSP